MRLRLYETSGSMFRATIHNAANHPRVRDELNTNRRLLREQFELQFGPELAALSPRARSSAVEAGNALTHIDDARPVASGSQPHRRRDGCGVARCAGCVAHAVIVTMLD